MGKTSFLKFFLFSALFLSCSRREPVSFPADGSLYGLGKNTVSGTLDISKSGRVFSYHFDPPLQVGPLKALELEYLCVGAGGGEAAEELKSRLELVIRVSGDGAWVLPWDASFLPVNGEALPADVPLYYTIPLAEGFLESFSITAEGEDGDLKRKLRDSPLSVRLRGLRIVPRWYGFFRDPAGAVSVTPFVYALEGDRLGIDPPPDFRFGGGDLSVKVSAGGAGDTGKGMTVEAAAFRVRSPPRRNELRIPSGIFPAEPYPILVEAPGLEFLRLSPGEDRPFPLPISLDPGLILSYPQNSWRSRDYEVFAWESFPSILIFDTADYAAQDRLFKRLAFFVEKAGYRGRLAGDEEIADLHGWNAHDYRAADLARFFELARARDFPLLKEERELEAILLDRGIIRREGGEISAGEGGIISISQESADYLRSLFMAHEGYHGLFFIDEDFRDFSRSRWDRLPRTAKRFILSYFDYQHYDVNDQYLVLNEFMAHVLQQPVSRAAAYFGETLAGRIDASPWRRAVLPEKDEAAGSWPELAGAFRAEAEAFSAYAGRRWGLSAGRVWQLTAGRAR
ncbi:MAG: hypothetical protein LBH26_07780 [Treponema sp.]|jgi:hypothetical protein|nr:hypothetical protein [Treponema sp.]